jgi:hypothetical protein
MVATPPAVGTGVKAAITGALYDNVVEDEAEDAALVDVRIVPPPLETKSKT